MTIARFLPLLLVVALSACGSDSGPSRERPPPPIEDTAFGEMAGTMDKARAVEATTVEHKKELDRSLQEAEGR